MQLHLDLALHAGAAVATAAGETAADAIVVNDGTEPVELDLVELSSASLALEIVDGRGAPVGMLPPPTPGRPEVVVLAPGARRTVAFRAFVPEGTPPGRYRARLRYRDARSDWVELQIR